jgi:sulfite reductase beta subunit
MAFISSGYNPAKPMENRITDIGPRYYEEFYPPIIKKNKGKWLYHENIEPGINVHVAESGDELYTIRCGGCRLMSVSHIREIMEIADKYCDGYVRWTTRNNVEFMVDSKDKAMALKKDVMARKQPGGCYKFPVGGYRCRHHQHCPHPGLDSLPHTGYGRLGHGQGDHGRAV